MPVCVGAAACNKSGGLPSGHNRQTCTHSPIPSEYLQDAATPGVCGSYADTLLAVNSALKKQGIPIKHYLLDSWWYGEGWNGGASLWEDVPTCTGNDTSLAPNAYPADTFPKGLKEFHKQVGLEKSIWVHNGFWSPTSPYRKPHDCCWESELRRSDDLMRNVAWQVKSMTSRRRVGRRKVTRSGSTSSLPTSSGGWGPLSRTISESRWARPSPDTPTSRSSRAG